MATLKEIQACQLNILKTVADICNRHNIPYYLACGTFLGAVRHQGFIPWDDDVDIYMGYNDLKKFKEICKKELPSDLFYQDVVTDSGAQWLFTKIRANGTYMPEVSPEDAKKVRYHQGIWIDIFPLLNAADSHEEMLVQIDAIHTYQHTVKPIFDIWKNKDMSLPGKIINFYWKLKFGHIAKKSRRRFERLQSDSSDRVIIMSNAYWSTDKKKATEAALKKTIAKSILQQQEYPFEDTVFYGFKDYDTYLTAEYGPDYMTPKRWAHLEDYSYVVTNN